MANYFNLEEILKLHLWIINDYGGSHGVRDENALRSLVKSPQGTLFGVKQYATVYEEAAVYMRNCIADHIFVDGNKRTGVTLGVIFLARSSCKLVASPHELEDFAVRIATDHLSIAEIADWLRMHVDER